MNTYMCRPFRFAWLGIVAFCFIPSLSAQPSRLAPEAIGQIVDQVIGAVIPPSYALSRVSVGNRKLLFDEERTLAAFGYASAQIAISDLGLRSSVAPGHESLLSDCDDRGATSCRQLGWSTYVWIKPISVTADQVIVRAYVVWPDRGNTPFDAGVSPKGTAFLVGFAADVELARSADGSWKFVKRRATITG